MRETNKMRRIVWRGVLAASASAIALTASTAAMAQDVVQTPAKTDDSSKVVDELIVTGSRIPRVGVDTVRPVVGVSPDDLDKRAFTNLSDALRELPEVGPGITPYGAQNSLTVGQNYVDLFNLGSQRTLTLVNGRRFVSSNVPSNFSSAGGLQVDYNALPVELLDHIEVVPLAGAAVYGSDAIAGTINVILKDHYQGFEASAQQGESELGDLASRQISGVMGTNFAGDRGNIAISVEYNKADGALATARPKWNDNRPLAIPFGLRLDANGNGTADQEYRVYFGQNLVAAGLYGSVSPTSLNLPTLGLGQVGGKYYQFTGGGNLAACTPGLSPGASSPLFAMGGTCGFDLVGDTTQIRSPVSTLNVTSLGHYDITNNIKFSVETMFSDSQATQLVEQGGFNLLAFGGTSAPLEFNTSNPFLSAQARQVLEGGLGPNSNFFVNRVDNDIVNGADYDQNYTARIVTALDGKFDWADRKFNWDVSAVFGKAHLQTTTYGILNGSYFDALDAVQVTPAYLQGLISAPGSTLAGDTQAAALTALQKNGLSGVSNIGLGSIICAVSGHIANGTVAGYNSPVGGSGTVGNVYPFAQSCQPLNIFGNAQQLNSASVLNYVTGGPRVDTADNQQRVLTASLTGDVIKLPAGWATVNAGIELHHEGAIFSPDLGSSISLTSGPFATFARTGGQTDTQEYFGELFLPLFSRDMNVPFLDLLEFNGSIRRVDEKSRDINNLGSGSNDSTTFEVGGRWSPVKDLVFRGSYTQAIRTPSLVELYTPVIGSYSMAQDPCDARYAGTGPSPAIRRANCIAAGINPDTFVSNAVNATIPIVTSGNPDLKPEESKAYTVGFVYQPRWADRLMMSVDYFHIDIQNRITQLTFTQVLDACYDSPSFPNSPACSSSLFQRDSTGQLTTGTTTNINAASSAFAATQGRLSWGIGVADALKMAHIDKGGEDLGDVSVDLTVLRTLENTATIQDEQPTNPLGTFVDPKWRATFDVTYRLGNLRLFWRTLFQSRPQFLTTDGSNYLVNLGPGQETTLATPANIVRNLDPYWMNNVSVQYTFFGRTSLSLTVNNIFNSMPSIYNRADGAYNVSDEVGRYYVLKLRQQF